MKWLDKLPIGIVIMFSLTIGLAPFAPEPHVVQKLGMLFSGNLSKGIDVFDLFMHGTPWTLLILKLIRMATKGNDNQPSN